MSKDTPPPGNSQSRVKYDDKAVIIDANDRYVNQNMIFDSLDYLSFQTTRRNILKLAGAAATSLLTGCIQFDTRKKAPGEGEMITVNPSDGLIDESIEILLSDFEPNEEITIQAHTNDSRGQTWLSFGRFITDNDGTLSLADQAPMSGTYEEVDSNGLLWSMRVPGESPKSFTENEAYTIYVTAKRNGETVASTTMKRRYISPGVVEHTVDEEGLVGVFFEPPGSGPHPAVLALHGTEGKVPWLMGAMLASHGYATLSLQYFDPTGQENLPSSLVEIPLEYFEHAIDWLLEYPSVTGDQVGVVGPSIGGELTLLLGATLSRIGAVVAYVPSGLIWQGPGGEQPMWTYDGKDISFVPLEINSDSVPSLARVATNGIRGRPIRVADLFRQSFSDLDAKSVKAATIPVEKIDGPVLLISGEDDGIWPSTALSDIAMHRLEEYAHPYPHRHLAYEKAGHIISIPFQQTAYWDTFEVMPGVTLKAGGTPSGNAHAATDSWPQVLEFFAEGLR